MAGNQTQDQKIPQTGGVNQVLTVLPALAGLFTSKRGTTTTTKAGGTTTQQTMLSDVAVKDILREMMEADQGGLARIASGQKTPGLYNATSRQLMIDDLMARAAAQVERARAPIVTTSTPQTVTEQSYAPAPIDPAMAALAAGGMWLANSSTGAKITGSVGDAIATGVGKATASIMGGLESIFGVPTQAPAPVVDAIPRLLGNTAASTAASTLGSIDWDAIVSSGDTLAAINAFGADPASFTSSFATPVPDVAGGFPVIGTVMNLAQGNVGGALGGVGGWALAPALGVTGPVGALIGSVLGGIFGGKGGKIICTELYRQGRMPLRIYLADQVFGKLQSADVMRGYHFWAAPLVRLMRKSPRVTSVVEFFALPWARHMAYKMGVEMTDSTFGRCLMAVGLPACKLIGKIISLREENYSYGRN